MNEFCNNCGEMMPERTFFSITALKVDKVDIDSANAGETTILCRNCFKSALSTFADTPCAAEAKAILAAIIEVESPSDTDPLTGVQYGELT